MKILFITVDYRDFSDTVFDGIYRTIGNDIVDYPTKSYLHGISYKDTKCNPTLFYHENIYSDCEKEDLIVSDYFDWICLCGTFSKDPLYNIKNIKIKKAIEKLLCEIPIFFIDSSDGCLEISKKELNNFKNIIHYFKREVKKDIDYKKHFGVDVIPNPISISKDYFGNYKKEKNNNFFWAGDLNHNRYFFIRECEKFFNMSFQKTFTTSEYFQIINDSKVCLNLYGNGYGTYRYYEIPAHGSLLLTQPSIIKIPNDFKNGVDCVTFENKEEMIEKIKYYLKNDDERETISKNGYDHVLKYHTTENRAKVILDKLKG